MKLWPFSIVALVGLMLTGASAFAQSTSEYYPAERSYYSYPRYFLVPDANLCLPARPLTGAETKALSSQAANDGDITTNPGVKARIDRDITTKPGRKDPLDNDITKRGR